MFTLIKLELKNRLRSSMTWFLIFVLVVMSLITISEIKEKRLDRDFIGHDSSDIQGLLKAFDMPSLINEQDKVLYPKLYYSALIRDNVGHDIVNASKENNIKELLRAKTFYNLLWAKSSFVRNDFIMDMVFKKKTIDIWNEVSNGVKYDDIDYYTRYIPEVEIDFLNANYYYNLYKKNIEPIYNDDLNNFNYTYQYFFKIVPLFMLMLPVVLIYNSINKEKNTGSLKLILTQSISRRKYYIAKWMAGTIQVLFIILVPVLIISLTLGIVDEFKPIDYPVFYLKDTLASFKPIASYTEEIKEELGDYPTQEKGAYYATPHRLPYFPPDRRVEIIPFYQYLLIVLGLTILYVGFAVGIVQLISAMINKEIIAFVISVLVFGIGILISSPFKYGKHYNLSPFTMDNASRIVIGTYNTTALTSIVILSVSILILLIIGIRYFKKKPI